MSEFLRTPLRPLPISPGRSVSDLVALMGGTSFQARNLSLGVDIWSRMLQDDITIYFGLAGAMVPAGMRQVIAYLIEKRLIDCLVSTGANLFHDLHETLGHFHWKGCLYVDDALLGKSGINRIYDVFASEQEFISDDEFITQFSNELDQSRPYTTREYLYLLGKRLAEIGKEEGILTAAAKANVPIYCPAIGDSVFGMAIAAGRVNSGKRLMFDIVQDVVETTRIAVEAKATGVVYVGGGTPKNFIQQCQVCSYIFNKRLEGHKYAIQVTADAPQWGGSSGCTFEESRSWRKVIPEARTVTINCDATIALPIMVSALAETCQEVLKARRKPTFLLGQELGIH